MKNLILNLWLILLSIFSYSQEYNAFMKHAERVKITDLFGNITIKGIDEEKVKVILTEQKSSPKTVKQGSGLELNNDNTGTGLSIKQNFNSIVITPSSLNAQFSDYTIFVPRKLSIKIDNSDIIAENGGMELEKNILMVDNMNSDIEINSFNSDIKINESNGAVIVNTFAGNISASFLQISNPNSLITFSGNIEVFFLTSASCNLKMQSFSGEVNSEFELHQSKIITNQSENFSKTIPQGKLLNDKKFNGKPMVLGSINKGGPEIILESYSGSISVKKK